MRQYNWMPVQQAPPPPQLVDISNTAKAIKDEEQANVIIQKQNQYAKFESQITLFYFIQDADNSQTAQQRSTVLTTAPAGAIPAGHIAIVNHNGMLIFEILFQVINRN